MLTNARSLFPKIKSLLNYFELFGLCFSIVTESWLANGTRLVEDLYELEHGTNLRLLYKNRPVKPNSRRRTAGGGVAIVYNNQRCNFKERKIRGNKFEIICAKGKIVGIPEVVVVLGIYIEPKTKVSLSLIHI